MAETPDTLREWALDSFDEVIHREVPFAHAAAWDDDILRQDVYDENYRKEVVKNAALEALIVELRAALDKYADHMAYCKHNAESPCTCGLDAARGGEHG